LYAAGGGGTSDAAPMTHAQVRRVVELIRSTPVLTYTRDVCLAYRALIGAQISTLGLDKLQGLMDRLYMPAVPDDATFKDYYKSMEKLD
jgi:hypothetical protein